MDGTALRIYWELEQSYKEHVRNGCRGIWTIGNYPCPVTEQELTKSLIKLLNKWEKEVKEDCVFEIEELSDEEIIAYQNRPESLKEKERELNILLKLKLKDE